MVPSNISGLKSNVDNKNFNFFYSWKTKAKLLNIMASRKLLVLILRWFDSLVYFPNSFSFVFDTCLFCFDIMALIFDIFLLDVSYSSPISRPQYRIVLPRSTFLGLLCTWINLLTTFIYWLFLVRMVPYLQFKDQSKGFIIKLSNHLFGFGQKTNSQFIQCYLCWWVLYVNPLKNPPSHSLDYSTFNNT